jgi:quinol monooxygenase YgiN
LVATSSAVIVALGDVYVQIPERKRARELMLATQRRASEQPGCISYVFVETLDEPGHFMTVQQWRDQAALDDHYRSQVFAEYQSQIAYTLLRTSELQIHEVQASYAPYDPGPMGPQDVD